MVLVPMISQAFQAWEGSGIEGQALTGARKDSQNVIGFAAGADSNREVIEVEPIVSIADHNHNHNHNINNGRSLRVGSQDDSIPLNMSAGLILRESWYEQVAMLCRYLSRGAC